MHSSRSLEMQAEFLDLASQSSWQATFELKEESNYSSIPSVSTILSETHKAEVIADGVIRPQGMSQSIADETVPHMTTQSQQETFRFESPWSTLEMTRLSFSQAINVDGFQSDVNTYESAWSFALPNGVTMNSTSSKSEGLRWSSSVKENTLDAGASLDGLSISSETTIWNVESDFLKQSVTFSRESMRTSLASVSNDLTDTAMTPSLATMSSETWSASQQFSTPLGNWQFDHSMTIEQNIATLDAVPSLELSDTAVLVAESSLVSCDFSPRLELQFSRVDNAIAAMPDWSMQSSQQSALGLLAAGLG